ncbi:MAG: hypothetical protein EAZ92_04045 [Candidatus Kapaibacterium sp.]|nr:MAG: hypothetical protein EAZ92_04045 [Candidatus Kapabacteria bacterium]
MKSVPIGDSILNFQPLPKGHLTYEIDWSKKPHRNQFVKKGKSLVTIDIQEDIWIGETFVPQSVWTKIMTTNPSKFRGDTKPVESVSYNEVEVFMDKLNTATGLHFRLPTESEFIYACVLNYDDAFFDTIEETVWFEKNSNRQTQPVNTKQMGKLNLSDVLGNLFHILTADITTVRADTCVYRGACWATQKLWVDKDYVMTMGKERKDNTVGFRLVLASE